MSYLIRLVREGKTSFAYRRPNKKDEWSTTMYPSQGTPFQTEKGAWRSIQQGDNLLASVTGSACWYDLFVKRGYTVSVVNSDTYHYLNLDESLVEKQYQVNLPVPNLPYSPKMSEAALMLYLVYREEPKITEQLIADFEEDFQGTFSKLEDFVWKSLNENLIFPQIQAIGLEPRHIDLEQLAYEWFNFTEYCSASYFSLNCIDSLVAQQVALARQVVPNREKGYFHVFAKRQP